MHSYHLSTTVSEKQGGQSWQPTAVCPTSSNLSSGAGRETEDNRCHPFLKLKQLKQIAAVTKIQLQLKSNGTLWLTNLQIVYI